MAFHVMGTHGVLGNRPFYEVRLATADCQALATELRNVAAAVGVVTIAVTHENPNRLRLKEDALPAYEARAPLNYVRGDVMRVQGVASNSCNLALSSRFGVPWFTQELVAAAQRGRAWVLMRVPTRSYDVVEFLPDVDLAAADEDAALAAAQAAGIEVEDFSDWETA